MRPIRPRRRQVVEERDLASDGHAHPDQRAHARCGRDRATADARLLVRRLAWRESRGGADRRLRFLAAILRLLGRDGLARGLRSIRSTDFRSRDRVAGRWRGKTGRRFVGVDVAGRVRARRHRFGNGRRRRVRLRSSGVVFRGKRAADTTRQRRRRAERGEADDDGGTAQKDHLRVLAEFPGRSAPGRAPRACAELYTGVLGVTRGNLRGAGPRFQAHVKPPVVCRRLGTRYFSSGSNGVPTARGATARPMNPANASMVIR